MQSSFLRPLSEDFIAFLAKVFAEVAPGQKFLMNWHLDVMAEHLEAVRRGELNRLIINVPPRSLKSVMVSVAWPAWLLGQRPTTKVMAASYAQALATKHSLDCRRVLQSGWYRQLFPETQLSREQNEKHKFMTTAQGMRMATSIWGGATGEGGDILIADDPMNPLQAQSALTRRYVQEWFEHTFATRLNDKRRGGIVIVMQRLHVDDLSGHLIKKGGWEVLRLPAIADTRQSWSFRGKPYIREVGALLHPAREDAALIERAKQELGSAHFAAQYQQNPIAAESGMIRLEWFKRFDD